MDVGAGRRDRHLRRRAPGLIGPLIAARHRGATVRAVPFAELANAVGAAHDARRLLARELDHRRARARAALAEVDVPVILDGAQGAGAVPVDVAALGCAAYAGRRPEVAVRRRRHRDALPRPGVRRARARRSRPATSTFEDATPGLESAAAPDARALRHARALARGGRASRSPRSSVLARRRLRRRARARPPRSPRRSPTRWPSAGHTVAPRGARRSSPGRTPDPRGHARPARRGRRRRPQPARARRTCAPRSAPGTNEADLERLLAAL